MGCAKAVIHFEPGPMLWNTRIDFQHISLARDAQDGFDTQSIHPARRTGIPRPTTAAGMWRYTVNIGGNAVRLHLVTLHVLWCIRMIDGVQQAEECLRAVALAEFGKRPYRPDGGMRVLPAILTN